MREVFDGRGLRQTVYDGACEGRDPQSDAATLAVIGLWGRTVFLVIFHTMLNTFGGDAGSRPLLTGFVIVGTLPLAGGGRCARR